MKNGMKALALATVLFATSSFAATVTFTIQPGTHEKPWNTPQTAIQLKVGDVLHIVNKDDVEHAIHTGGKPFKHTGFIQPGESYDADVTDAWPVSKALYDHFYQETGFVYVNVTE